MYIFLDININISTMSAMINTLSNSKDEARVKVVELLKYINSELLTPPMELTLELIVDMLILISKKMYIKYQKLAIESMVNGVKLITYNEKIDYKGVLPAKKGEPTWAKNLYKKITELIIHKASLSHILLELCGNLKLLLEGYVSYKDLIIITKVKEVYNDKKSNISRFVNQIKDRVILKDGDFIQYLLMECCIEGKVRQSDKFMLVDDYELCKNNGLDMDLDYLQYIKTSAMGKIDKLINITLGKRMIDTGISIKPGRARNPRFFDEPIKLIYELMTLKSNSLTMDEIISIIIECDFDG